MDEKREKLIRSKQQWAAEGRLLTGRKADPSRERLPPGQRLVKDWPVLDLGIHPEIAPDDWSLTVGGLVEAPLRWDWAAFMSQPQAESVSDIHCVTSWSRFDNRWTGVATRHLIDLVKPRPETRFVLLKSFDGYTTNLPFENFAAEDALIAHSWEGKPLSREHGGPARLVVPSLYFWKSAKWLRAIAFAERDEPGYWEKLGYHDVGDPWNEERYQD
ncbi:sulfite oxidase-like oxidoreductase [Telmatospirillum sp. J64-1]|uniref:sulfite oxidase-like oxidoreductase n=1 Tax=Telmatospirillum sp. J64-1 TaxID=2502183 RepID=UPI00115C49CD|nr:sulfite oxidase-like oxidoreductase [Telmatospirillum sp. J64-1]